MDFIVVHDLHVLKHVLLVAVFVGGLLKEEERVKMYTKC